VITPSVSAWIAVNPPREPAQQRAGVVRLAELLEQRVTVQLSRRQIAEMLIDPLRHEAADDAFAPLRLGALLLKPSRGDIPVVVSSAYI
jgi:hypothetical protein